MGFLDDVINPVGAITGVDPVKQMTGFTGTGFDKKPGAASSSGGATPSGGGYAAGGGGSGPPPSAGQYMQQFQQQQGSPFNQFGAQLAAMAAQVRPPAQMHNPTAPSAQDTAAAVTSQAVQNKQQQTQMFGFQPQNFWSNFPT